MEFLPVTSAVVRYPLEFSLSLDNLESEHVGYQLLGHIPVTQISSVYTQRLDSADDEGSDDDSLLPELSDMFKPGDWLRAIVTRVQPPGSKAQVDLGAVPTTDEERSCAKLELSIAPGQVNVGITKGDLTAGFVRPFSY